MKLWQKIFLCSFALMIVVIDVTSTIIISNNHRMNMEREESKAISEYEHCASTIVNRLVYERLKRDEILLNPEQIPEILVDMEDVYKRQDICQQEAARGRQESLCINTRSRTAQ